MTPMLRFALSVSIAIAFGAVTSACTPATSRALQPSSQGELKIEPTPAADFLTAFRRGDEVTAEQQASPLYRQEWARRKITVEHRQGWLPPAYRAGNATADWINVAYGGGFVDGDGNGHLIYVGRGTHDAASSIPSVWRLDTDATGRVTWAEMVWLFSDNTKAVTSVSGSGMDGTSYLPPAFNRMQPRFVVGVHSTLDWEGYYAIWHTAGDHLALTFFAIDESGKLRPGVWTYQQVHAQ